MVTALEGAADLDVDLFLLRFGNLPGFESHPSHFVDLKQENELMLLQLHACLPCSGRCENLVQFIIGLQFLAAPDPTLEVANEYC